jgi:protein SDA1
MISSLCFLLDYEKIENYQDSDDSSSDEDMTESPQVILRRETIYKVRLFDKH